MQVPQLPDDACLTSPGAQAFDVFCGFKALDEFFRERAEAPFENRSKHGAGAPQKPAEMIHFGLWASINAKVAWRALANPIPHSAKAMRMSS